MNMDILNIFFFVNKKLQKALTNGNLKHVFLKATNQHKNKMDKL